MAEFPPVRPAAGGMFSTSGRRRMIAPEVVP